MPSYKPQPKLYAYSAQDESPEMITKREPAKYHPAHSQSVHVKKHAGGKKDKIVISKDQIKYSRNKQSLDLDQKVKDKLLNTYQPNIVSHGKLMVFWFFSWLFGDPTMVYLFRVS